MWLKVNKCSSSDKALQIKTSRIAARLFSRMRVQKGSASPSYVADSKLSYGMFSPSCSRFTICRLSLRLYDTSGTEHY